MSLLAVSDLHIQGPEDPLYASLLTLMRDEAKAGDRLVLAGDVFDLFVGNKPVFLDRYRDFLAEARAAGERGVQIDYIEGNHDFHIRRAFAQIPGFKVHSHHVAFSHEGRRFFIEHGDTVDRGDYGYRALRVFFRSPVMKTLVKLAPGSWLDAFGRKSSQVSRDSQPRLPHELPASALERLRRVYRNHAVTTLERGHDFVIMGHCHDLDEMTFLLGGRTGQYCNVGYPRVHGSYLRYDASVGALKRVPLPGLPQISPVQPFRTRPASPSTSA